MSLGREEVHEIVSIFYQPTFKTFYVNSVDGKTFVKPLGVFVSLGITTSVKVLEKIQNILNEKYNACLAEISSIKVGEQFLNTLVNTTSPKQYELTEFGNNVLDKDGAQKEIGRMRNLMNPEESLAVLQEYAPKISRLQDLIEKLDADNGWKDHMIQEEDDDYRIFHKKVNYKKEGDVEYRLGIYVSEKE